MDNTAGAFPAVACDNKNQLDRQDVQRALCTINTGPYCEPDNVEKLGIWRNTMWKVYYINLNV